ncbi:MAG: hypothetical protein ABIS39_01345 [Sphingomicrobium sp.]
MPNLKSDRGIGMAGVGRRLNVRRLMYQTLIWAAVARDNARRLGPPLHAKDVQGLADALVDGVRGDSELVRDFLGREVLVDQQEAVELARAEPRNPACMVALGRIAIRRAVIAGHATDPPPIRMDHYSHDATPEQMDAADNVDAYAIPLNFARIIAVL